MLEKSLALAMFVALAPLATAAEPIDLLTEVRERFSGYLEAFNSGNVDELGPFWAEDALSVDETTGERTVGRAAIFADLREFFADAADSKLAGEILETRPIRPDVAIAEGSVTLFTPGRDPVPSAFTLVLVKQSDGWVIASSYERDLPSPATPADALQDLAWLIGDWRDDTEGVNVQTSVRWSSKKAFLLRSFQADYGDGETFEGTQVIGWDPQVKQYRTWTFNSDGSFGEGLVSRSGDDWLIKMSHVNSDGGISSGTQVITQVDLDTLRVEKIGQTVDGVPVPTGDPVTVLRVGSPLSPPAPVGAE